MWPEVHCDHIKRNMHCFFRAQTELALTSFVSPCPSALVSQNGCACLAASAKCFFSRTAGSATLSPRPSDWPAPVGRRWFITKQVFKGHWTLNSRMSICQGVILHLFSTHVRWSFYLKRSVGLQASQKFLSVQATKPSET